MAEMMLFYGVETIKHVSINIYYDRICCDKIGKIKVIKKVNYLSEISPTSLLGTCWPLFGNYCPFERTYWTDKRHVRCS